MAQRWKRQTLLSRWASRMAPYGVAALLFVGVQQSRIAETLDLLVYDLIISKQSLSASAALPITVIGIRESDLVQYGWPLDDQLLCRAIDTLLIGGASVVGLDLYRDQGVGQNRRCLKERFRVDGRLVSVFNESVGIAAVPGTPAGRQAFNDLVLDDDGVVRRDLVHVGEQGEATVSFPLRLVEISEGSNSLRRRIEAEGDARSWLEKRSGGYAALDASGYQRMMEFRLKSAITHYSLEDVLRDKLPANKVAGQIVIIGSVAPSLRDLFEIPHTRFRPGASPYLLPGVDLHALRAGALLMQQRDESPRLMQAATGWQRSLVDIFAIAIGITVGEAVATLRRSMLVIGIVALLLGGLAALLLTQGFWIGITPPISGLLLMAGSAWLRRGVVSQQHRVQMESLLGQTTSPAIARQMWEQRDQLLTDGKFEGRRLFVTAVFADTYNFTAISETLTPAALLDWFNRGMGCCVPAITRHGGMVNKFTGDGFFAVFGAPLGRGPETEASAAIDAVLEIQTKLQHLNETLTREGAPNLRLRIGVHSGFVLAGSMGSSDRLEYAIMGDTVNCASRLESINKEQYQGVCRVLVSAETKILLPEDRLFSWRCMGLVKIRGRSQQLEAWEMLGDIKSIAPEDVQAKPGPSVGPGD